MSKKIKIGVAEKEASYFAGHMLPSFVKPQSRTEQQKLFLRGEEVVVGHFFGSVLVFQRIDEGSLREKVKAGELAAGIGENETTDKVSAECLSQIERHSLSNIRPYTDLVWFVPKGQMLEPPLNILRLALSGMLPNRWHLGY